MDNPPEGGGNGGVGANGDAAMADGRQEARIGGHPADAGRARATIRGALMVVGTMAEAQVLAKQLGMADLRWLQEGGHVQRAEFDEWQRSPQLERAIAASAAREWVTANTTRVVRWRFDVATPRRRRPTHEHHRWPPMEPTARKSVAPQRGAEGSPSTSNAWQHPLRPPPPPVRPSPPSQEELRKWIQTEVASRLAPYEQLLEEAKTVIAGKDVEIASLKAELEMVKAQKKLSAAPAAEPASPTDLKCQPGTRTWRHLQVDFMQLRKEAREAMSLCKGMRDEQFRLSTELVLQQSEISGLQKRLKEEQLLKRMEMYSPSPQTGGVLSLSEPVKEKGQNQQGNLHGWTATAASVPIPQWPSPAEGFQYTTRISDASALPTQAFSFADAANQQMPAFVSTGSFFFQQPVPEAVTPAPSCPTMKDGFAVALSGSNPERTPDSDRGAVGKQVAAVLEVRVELTDTPPKAAATRSRIKRHVSPGLNTPQEPSAKKGMVEEEEEEGDGTDADIGRWAAAEYMEAEHAEEDAAEEVRGGLEGQVPDGYDEEKADQTSDQEQKRRRGEEAGARRGHLFTSTDENL